MKRMFNFYGLCLAFLVPALSGTENTPLPNPGNVWRDTRRPLSELRELRDEKTTLPTSRWIGRDQRSVERDMEKIKARLLEVLEHSELTAHRDAYHALVAEQEVLRGRVRSLREEQLSAPNERARHQVFTKTRDDYAREIGEVLARIEALDDDRLERIEAMRAEYADMGISLTRDQVLFYLSSVSGSDIMAMSALFHHTRSINEQLEHLIKSDPGDLESARRYYGVHVVLLETLQFAHDRMIEKIEDQYLRGLSDLEAENEALIHETEALLARSSPDQRAILLNNRDLQDITARTLQAYRQHLDQVREQVTQRRAQLSVRHEIAANSYATLRVSSALATQIEQLLRELNTLQSMHLPELLPFDNAVIEEKFRAITRELEGAR